jgi:hypothetical protein
VVFTSLSLIRSSIVSDHEVSAFVREAQKALAKAFESGQRNLRTQILRMISKNKKGKSKATRIALEELFQEIMAMRLPTKVSAKKKKAGSSDFPRIPIKSRGSMPGVPPPEESSKIIKEAADRARRRCR